MGYGTFPFSVPTAPTGLVYQNLSSTSILVSWEEPSTFNGVPDDYMIFYTREETNVTENVTSPVTNVTISMLEKYEEYRVVIFAASDKGLGNSSIPLMVLTDEDGELVLILTCTISASFIDRPSNILNFVCTCTHVCVCCISSTVCTCIGEHYDPVNLLDT